MEGQRSSSSTVSNKLSSSSTTPEIKSQDTTARPLYSSKLSSDQKSRFAATPADNSSGSSSSSSTTAPSQANRQSAARQKAWTGARNPITGRSPTPQTAPRTLHKQFATASLQEGQNIIFTLANGAEFEGIYASNPADAASCFLRMVQQKKGPNSADISNGAVKRDNMSFQRKDIADARALSSNNAGKNDGRTTNGNRGGFRTDAAISNSRGPIGRDLQRWEPDTKDVDPNMSLERSSGVWDQFATNERLFGLKTDYDETIYTTAIDTAHPAYRQRVALADRTAREIEKSAPVTSHVAEERQMDFVGGADDRNEEDKYSGVRRQADYPPLGSRESRENKYTPPARRAPTGHTTVKGAPVDPAIISSQLKAPAPKQQMPKSEENKVPAAQAKASTTPTPEVKVVEAKQDIKVERRANDTTPAAAATESTTNSTAATPLRPSATTSRAISPQTAQGNTNATAAPSAAATVEKDVLASFKNFASKERAVQEKVRSSKARADKEVKLHELKKFGETFKLSTPVPKDLISIIAKDPVKQKAIQEKALQDAEEVKKKATQEATAAVKPKQQATAATTRETQVKVPAEPTTSTAGTPAPAAETRAVSRPSAPQHSSSPSAVPGRQPGARQSYAPQQHYQQPYRGNRQNSQFGGQQAPPPQGGLGQRIRDAKQMHQQPQHQHQHQHQHQQHMPVDNMRYAPTGPSNGFDQQFGRRGSGVHAAQYQQAKTLRPNAVPFAPAYAGPSQASSPRSAIVTAIAEPPRVHMPPARGQLIRRKTKAVDVNKCNILLHLTTLKPPAGANWTENLGLRPSFQTPVTWRAKREDVTEKDANIALTYKEWFDRQPMASAATATPNPHAAAAVMPHHHQLPFHLQQGVSHTMPPRPSPHMAPIPMHNGQPGPMAHGPPFNHADDHRMMQSNSAQSFSPRMHQQMAMPYGQNMNSPGPVYMPPVQQGPPMPYMNNAAPPMNPNYRSFSNNSQYMGQQQHMAPPMMAQPPYMQPNPVVQPGQMGMYPSPGGHFMPPPGTGAPPSVAGSNGYPSPGRGPAPMMVQQGSQQGQPMSYGMSPGMYHPQLYQAQPPQNKYQGQRP